MKLMKIKMNNGGDVSLLLFNFVNEHYLLFVKYYISNTLMPKSFNYSVYNVHY
jgi:hypothetical protein